MMIWWVDSKSGNDANAGTKDRPFRTTSKLASLLERGDTVHLAPGAYALPKVQGVTWKGAAGADRAVVAGRDAAATDARYSELHFKDGLSFYGDVARARFANCLVTGSLSVDGAAHTAPTGISFFGCKFRSPHFWFHAYGDDRRTDVPHITGFKFRGCDIRLERPAGVPGVLWRMSSTDDLLVDNCTIYMKQHDTVGGSDDSAAMKRLWCRNQIMRGNQWFYDHPEGISGGTGPFWMDRDDTSYNVHEYEYHESLRGGLWYSPNTAGTWICACKGQEFRHCAWKVKGRMLLYQCTPAASDVWENCKVFCDNFDWYKAPKNMPGITVHPYEAAP